ncbi:MAG: hypothetical protein O3C63_03905 [Cyanobacteria bacterium]|nr:hypothetical protein [Cyanobacteriota bacterium]MDA1020333.1 hypothetical protein [Cyanobacteriota bacterium]
MSLREYENNQTININQKIIEIIKQYELEDTENYYQELFGNNAAQN